jgi:hypothetical protein
MSDKTLNPAGTTLLQIDDNKVPGPPAPDVAAKQDPEHTQVDFLRDLDKVTQRPDDRP